MKTYFCYWRGENYWNLNWYYKDSIVGNAVLLLSIPNIAMNGSSVHWNVTNLQMKFTLCSNISFSHVLTAKKYCVILISSQFILPIKNMLFAHSPWSRLQYNIVKFLNIYIIIYIYIYIYIYVQYKCIHKLHIFWRLPFRALCVICR